MISIDLEQIILLNDKIDNLHQKQIDRLTQQNIQMELVINEFLELIDNSQGVAGLHLNGNIATWRDLIDSVWLCDLNNYLENRYGMARD